MGATLVRLIFNIDRLGRGGDHYIFYKAGLPAVRFTEPLEDYRHQHQTPRTENGVEYGDQMKYLNFEFMGNVARDNAEALRQLALAPAPPEQVKFTGGVTPDAKIILDQRRRSPIARVLKSSGAKPPILAGRSTIFPLPRK